MTQAEALDVTGKLVKLSAGIFAIAAVVLIAYALLTPEQTTDETDHMGMNGPRLYSSGDVGIIAIALVMMVGAAMIVLLWKEYEPLPPDMVPPQRKGGAVQGVDEPTPAAGPESSAVAIPVGQDEGAERNYLVLRLLTGDERTMFKAIMDSGGEALQKDLILKTRMSNAKVSRVLDRLSQKGIITKERHGATNKVRIRIQG